MSSTTTTSPASGVSGEAPPPRIVEDCLGLVQLMSDGTVKRAPASHVLLPDDEPAPPCLASADDDAAPVRCKDVVYDEARNLSLRMYVPSSRAGNGGAEKKLPVLVYFHGGGFIVGSFASPEFHAACARLAAALPAVVLSADYRLAPEHRLPAALQDADAIFSWLGAQEQQAAAGGGADPWLADAADLGRVFVSGDSAGANIAHHAAAAPGRRLAGCVLLWPFFGGERRTRSEAACLGDAFLTLPLYDQMWRLALPAGATRDHPAANPEVGELPPLLVAAGDRDMLIDRIREYVARARARAAAAGNRRVDLVEFPGAGHGFAILEPDGEAAGELVRVVRRFVHGG
jgi:acetyl esterase/lipase